MVFLPRTGFISCTLLNVALSHDSCHLDKMYLLIKGLKSVHGSLKFEISISSEAFAFTSAASLPLMPTWLGNRTKFPSFSITRDVFLSGSEFWDFLV